MCLYCILQRLNQTTNVELEASKLTPTATLQAAPTERERKQDPEQKKSTAKVCTLLFKTIF